MMLLVKMRRVRFGWKMGISKIRVKIGSFGLVGKLLNKPSERLAALDVVAEHVEG